jgi:hypothetical protein
VIGVGGAGSASNITSKKIIKSKYFIRMVLPPAVYSNFFGRFRNNVLHPAKNYRQVNFFQREFR